MSAEYATMLHQHVSALDQSDQIFAKSLLNQLARKQSLSDKQWPWVKKLAERAQAKATGKPDPSAKAPIKVGSLAGVKAMLDKAGAHMKYPKITLATADQRMIRLAVATQNSKQPGTINVASGGVWLGRATKEGVFEPSRAATDLEPVLDLLNALSADPVKVVAEYGQMSGNCCFCYTPITDPRSKKVGYGATCAKHFGLPWG